MEVKKSQPCEHCEIVNCPILNKTACPINEIWEKTDELTATVRDIETMLKSNG